MCNPWVLEEPFNTTKSTNIVQLTALVPNNSIELEVEADTGANITVAKAEILEEMDWIEMEPTNVHIKGYSGIAEPCVCKAKVNLKRRNKSHKEKVFFGNSSTSNFFYLEMPAKHLESSQKDLHASSWIPENEKMEVTVDKKTQNLKTSKT